MEILQNYSVPTGNILVVDGKNGPLEVLSIGDYGKEVNLKSDALGLTRDIPKVEHAEMMPLEDKWVITLSTQYGCSMGCKFCDVPIVGPGKNATTADMMGQIEVAMSIHPEVTWTNRLNVHFARMGEPTWNKDVLRVAAWLKEEIDPTHKVHPVVSTMMPRHNKGLEAFVHAWMEIKNHLLAGDAGLQLSINSTNEDERADMFCNNSHTLKDIAGIMDGIEPIGRKITLNFAVADYEIDPSVLLYYFNPEDYIIKLTPMHKTDTALRHSIRTGGDYTTMYPYSAYEDALKDAGYDVLVFIASVEEDLGRITCGNAILSGSRPVVEYTVS